MTEQTKSASKEARAAFTAYTTYTEGTSFRSATPEAQNLGEKARLAMLTFLNLIANSPSCFTETEVAQAQAALTTWEQPGTVPAPTAASVPNKSGPWWASHYLTEFADN